MKIGILTFHRAHNYGAVLQCYALQELLKYEGHDVYIIDYKLPFLLNCYKPFNIRRFIPRRGWGFLRIYKELGLLVSRFSRYRKFDKFIKSELQLKSDNSVKQDYYDLIIIGSDQVWNTKLTHGFDSFYWGNFGAVHAKIVSYAASIGEFWNKNEDKEVQKLLGKFNAISVREDEAAKKMQELLPDKNIVTVLDPTLLIPRKVWDDFAKKPRIKEKYLLLYQVRDSLKAKKIAQDIAQKTKLRIVFLSAKIEDKNSNECISASPQEFVGWFKYASYIVCTSFHGTVFSLIFNKPFYSIRLNDGKDSRVEHLLKMIDGMDRMIDECPKNINFSYHNTNFGDLSYKSFKFIHSCTNRETF